jgi:hypothetical protein
MAINVDLSKPLTDDQIEELRTRLPNELVDHYIARSNATDDGADKKPTGKRAAKADADDAGKDGDLLK